MGDGLLPLARFEPPTVRAIVRERVDRRLDRAWEVPLTIVVGPAGAGKTPAASHLVQRSGTDVVWYRAHPVDGDEAVFAEHLGHSVNRVTGRAGSWAGLAALLVDVERTSDRLLVVIDEFDAVIGTATERAFGDVLVDLPPSIHFVTLSRYRPSINLSRLRLGPGVVEVGPDDLRFRSWEVDRLFRELYRRPLLPNDVAELERRTGGWVAALQLFNLATTTLPAAERQATIAHVGRRSGPDWDFLADNVLSGLSDELQLFLLETAPLERLSATLCDALLSTRSGAQRLAELERLQLVTSSMEAPGSFRSHEVLRSHLDGLLMEWEGADAVRKRYRRAAETLEDHGHFAEALRAYCRGEDWPSASRLLGSRGAEVADRPGSWLTGLPGALVQADPWLLLANARQQRADGRIQEAIATYQQVERAALTSAPVTVARRERLLLASLLDRSSFPSLAWVAALRDAVVGDPEAAIAPLTDRTAHELLAIGFGQLLAGEVNRAVVALRRARDRTDASPTISAVAAFGLLVATHLAGGADPDVADDLERAVTALEIPFLVRLCRAAGAMVTGSLELADAAVVDCDRNGDAAGAALAAVLAAVARVWGPAAPAYVTADALQRCRALGLRTLEVWAQVTIAFGAIGRPEGPACAAAAELAARRRGLRPMHELAELAAAASTGAVGVSSADLTARVGLAPPASVRLRPGPAAASAAAHDPVELRIQCFGRFVVHRDGADVDLGELRPRARAVLRMLAVHHGTGVHRQTLCDEHWPDDGEASAARKLQVAISSIRRVFDLVGLSDVVRRRDDVYLLDPDKRVFCDVHGFSTAVGEARTLIARGAADDAVPVLRHALELYAGDLLPEDGATEWVVAARQGLQASATETARALAATLIERGLAAEAAEVCRRGLAIDRFSDPLWRLLLDALHADGNLAGHARAQAAYDDVLVELGVSGPLPSSR